MLDAYTLLEMGLNFFILTSAGLLIRVIYFACWPLRTIYLVRVSPDCLLSIDSVGPQGAAGDAGEARSGRCERRVRAAETLWGAHGAEAEAGVPEYEGHDGKRVREIMTHSKWLKCLKMSETLHAIKHLVWFSTSCTAERRRASGVKRSWRRSSGVE